MSVIDTSQWQEFPLEKLFKIVKGTRLTKRDMVDGDINYIGATAFNNGITAHIGNETALHKAGTLTVTYNGSIGETFYQEEPFWASDDVNILYPQFKMTRNIAHFLATIIKVVGKNNYAYEDKWQIEDMKKTAIKLPVTSDGEPDFAFMESYMDTLRERAVKPKIALLKSLL